MWPNHVTDVTIALTTTQLTSTTAVVTAEIQPTLYSETCLIRPPFGPIFVI